MKFDSNQAWKQAAAWVSANRDVLVALSGVFFLLPRLAFSLFLPQPEPQAGLPREQLVLLARSYYLQALPFAIPMLILQALGTLAMLTLFTDQRRPTVAQSIRSALTGIIPYVLAQLMLGLSIGIVAALLATMAAMAGSPVLLTLVIAVIVIAAVYLAVRTSLSGPVIAVEHVRNPVAALSRSWRLTQGNSLRLVLFYLLIALAFTVIVTIVMALFGILVALVASGTTATVASAVASSALGTVMTVYFIAILGAVHRQFAGRGTVQERATFE